ncbi:MAG: hypothetical protein M3Q65_25850, partial [Chloroflexota bacterium]|nr:hypothetical protein [Chloroflexota bacterium]
MELVNVRNDGLGGVLGLDPADCLTLADACHLAEREAAEAWAGRGEPAPALVRPEHFAALKALFAGLAVAGTAGAYGATESSYGLAHVREEYHPARRAGRQ